MDEIEFKSLVKSSGFRKHEIATMLGVSRATVNNWERGKEIPETKHEFIRQVLSGKNVIINDEERPITEVVKEIVLRQDEALKDVLFKEFIDKLVYKRANELSSNKSDRD